MCFFFLAQIKIWFTTEDNQPAEDILAYNEDRRLLARQQAGRKSKYLEQLIYPAGENIALDLGQTFSLKLAAPPFA